MNENAQVSIRVRQLLAAWGMITALILTTACSKKYTSPLPPPPQEPTQTGGQPNVVTAPTPTPTPKSSAPISQEVGGDDGVYGEDSIVHYDPAGPGTDDLFDPRGGETSVEAEIPVDEGPYFYSTSANDDLYQRIQNIIEAETNKSRKTGDRKFAAKIRMASFRYSQDSRNAELLVDLENKSGVERITLRGRLDQQMRLRAYSHNRKNEYVADVVCMDLSGTCQNVHVRLTEFQSANHTHVAHVIVRTTYAAIFIEGNGPGIASNPDYDRFLQILLNTVKSPRSRVNNLRSLVVTTSEVVGGSSQFAIGMRMVLAQSYSANVSDETIIWRGPLVKPRSSDRMSLVIEQDRSIVRGATYSTLVSDSIRETRLVRNDGRGTLQLLVTIRRAHAGANEDVLRLTISRVMKPVGRVTLR